jgi:glycosyltransferase involved in cell wall biosynthesis
MRGIVFTQETGDALLTGRTWRMLSSAGVTKIDCVRWKDVPDVLVRGNESVWLARAGTWQPSLPLRRAIPPSATGRPLIGLGHGGPSVYLEKGAARALSEILRAGTSFDAALQKLAKRQEFRCVPLHDIDVAFDASPRSVQVVTSIQMGGAERVAIDLAQEFNRAGWRTALAALGSPTRHAYPVPPLFADLSKAGLAPRNRAVALHEFALSFGADILHAHLITAEEAAAIRAHGVPLAVTMHNALPIWPEGWAELDAAPADLLIGCAHAVSRELESRFSHVPVRTVWNGINPARYAPSEAHDEAGARLRDRLGWDRQDFVLLCVANPRPQKRLHRLPEIVASLDELIAPRRVRLLLAGEPAAGNPAAQECMVQLFDEVDRWHSRKTMHWAGAVDDLGPLFAAADAFIAVSSQEGLSLAQLEALAAGLPVVATDVGGTCEIAARSNRLSILRADAAAEAFATVLGVIAHAPPPRVPALPPDFTHDVMARRCQLYLLGLLASRVPHPAASSSAPAWLITNNFTTGGAQSSARRLLTGLHNRGHEVRAATLEEFADRPAAGTKALLAANVPVINIRPSRDARAMASQLIEEFSADPPRAILLWNVIPPVKLLLADILHGVPIFDVSPGEMLFRSLDRFLTALPAGWLVGSARDYGSRLAGTVVKYSDEAARAASILGAPVHIIRNGIAAVGRSPRPAGKIFVFGTLARISPDKCLDQLIEAFRLALPRMPLCRLRIGGSPDGSARGHLLELKQLAQGLPIEWCGEIKDSLRFFASLDLFAVISEPAGCPNASLEAMASGLAVIATDHGGVSEQVIDNVTGRLVPRGDVERFAEALIQVANDPVLRTRLAEAAHAHVQTEFSLDKMLDAYAQLIGLEALKR